MSPKVQNRGVTYHKQGQMSAKKFKGMKKKQESITVGCVPPACQLYMFWWLSLDVNTIGLVGILGMGILGMG